MLMKKSDHYASKLSSIRAIPDDVIQVPASIPVKIYLQEAENIFNWCQPDKERLAANGLQWAMVEDMPARIDALREAQARWSASDSGNIDIEKEWDEKSSAAHLFRKELYRSMKFIFRKNSAAVSKIAKLGEGGSSASVIQALRDVSAFGRDHIEFIRGTTFDAAKLDTAADMSRDLASLLGAVNSRRSFCSDTLKIRNQAYTYLKEAVDELKNHANFVLWRDPVRLKGYYSDYTRKKYLKSKNLKVQSASIKETV
jgi:hypothetical protein